MKKSHATRISAIVVSFLLIAFFSTSVWGQVVINELVASNQQGFTDEDGDYPDWIELYNSGDEAIDLTGYGISDDPEDPFQWVIPEIELEAGGYILILASDKDIHSEYLHTNFKLSSSGETVVLTDMAENAVDQTTYPPLNPDESYGRPGDNPGSWVIFDEPTPLQENPNEGFASRLSIPQLTNTGGFYSGSVQVNFASETADNIYYTTDGTEPESSSNAFSPPISFSETTVLRLRAIEEGRLSSDIETYTYFVNADHDLPVISLVTEPDLLWSDEQGIYVVGTNGISGNCFGPANWNQDWEIPAHIEFYEEDDTYGFSSDVGTKIFGGCSRMADQKSLSAFFRGEYGNPELEYPLFEEKDINTFQALVLRNSGNDFGYSHIRDAMMTTLIKEDSKIDYQAYRPAVVYLNGEYWGIHNIREKINEHFIASNHNVDADDIDLIENNGEVKHGQPDAYNEFMNDLGNANMQNQANYETVTRHVDMDNYIDYMITQIFYVNQDWPGNNLRYWRERRVGAKFRWIIYDTDFGFNMYYNRPPERNMFPFVTATNGPDWPNPPWSTYIFRKFLENESFEQAFVNRFGDLLNTAFQVDHIIATIDSLTGGIEPEMNAHQSRWGRSMEDWQNEIGVLKHFAQNRTGYIESHITAFFGVDDRSAITVNVAGEGEVRVNRVTPGSYPWSGEYFGGVPVEITATPKPGYMFTGWSGSSSSERTLQVQAEDEPNLTANFEEISGEVSDIVINEIMYNAPDETDPEDWIELYNPNDFAMNIGGWIVKDDDDDHEFFIPENTLIAEDGYLVISQNREAFAAIYTNAAPVVGDIDFGLGGGGDQVRLYDSSGMLVDSVEYDDSNPWPTEADGNGYTLELTDPFLDNTLPENWAASAQTGGTPTTENGIITSGELDAELPSSIALQQNYPNPFNPTTVISYELSENNNVKLEVFDMLGRKVATLINNERKSPGFHQVTFDAGNLASGVYIYQLKAGQETFTKKMLLAK